MIEQRLTSRMVKYWETLQKGDNIPKIEQFNPGAIADLWQRCFKIVIYKERASQSYIYDYVGEELDDIFGKGLVGSSVKSRSASIPAKKMIEHMEKSIKELQPNILEGQFVSEKNQVVKYRSCLLPFGHDKDNVTHFIIGFSWRAF